MNEKDLYFVAVKVFLEKEGQFLVCKDGFGAWDIPGGRLKKDEFTVPLEQVIARKMREELGDALSYELGAPEILMRHERVEAIEGFPSVRIFAVGYRAQYISGDILLASHHTEYRWVDMQSLEVSLLFTAVGKRE